MGGKTRGLAALVAAGFEVPEGFVALPEAGAEKIIAAYRRLGTGRVAVRSSAAEEDSQHLSYAGQFETILNVEGEEALLKAVAACRASGSAARVAGYRHAVSADSATGSAAREIPVIVQRMLSPEYAGVAFVQAGGRVTVEGVAGAGDALVSGQAAPAALPAELRARVETLAREVAERLGGPQDIEWAFENGRVWLLQARPLTAALPGELPAKFRIWTATNVQEAIPRPLTPLSEEFVEVFLNQVFEISYRSFGLPQPDGPHVRFVKGRPYMSYSAIASAMSAMPGFRVENTLRMYGDGPELAPFLSYTPRPKLPTLLRMPGVIVRTMGWAVFFERRNRGNLEAVVALEEELKDVAGLSDGELLSLFRSPLTESAEVVKTMTVATALAMAGLGMLMQAGRQLAPRVSTASLTALAAGGEMQSVEPARQLAAIGRWLRAHPNSSDDHPELRALLARFFETCGFRSGNETEWAEAPWNERPGDVLRMARQLAAALPPRAPDPAPLWLRVVLWPLAAIARLWQKRREAARAVLGRGAQQMRRLLLEIGRRAHARSIIAGAADVFYLRRSEVEAVLLGDATEGLAARVESRRRRHRQLLALPPPSRLLAELPGGRLAPFQPDSGEGHALRGFAASPGRVTGRARVLKGLEEASHLQPGEILVARTTDIGWTPLFHLAAAVVTEIGAPTSHAAIVARELGVPAVVNIDRATELIQDGDLLLVDGWAGLVRIETRAGETG